MTVVLLVLALAAGTASTRAPHWTVYSPEPETILEIGRDPQFRAISGGRFLLGCGLFRLDGHGVPQPDLARRAAPRESGRVWDVTLRSGLRLADGTALDAASFVRLWSGQIGGQPRVRWLLAPLAQPPVALDENTIRFRLTEPRPDFRRRLAHPWLALLDPQARSGDDSSLGPYRLLPTAPSVAPREFILAGRGDHDHGMRHPGDLKFTQEGAGVRWCAGSGRRHELIIGATAQVHGADLVQAAGDLDAGPQDRVQPRRSVDRPESSRAGRRREFEVLLDRGDADARILADRLQARLLDAGIRLQRRFLAGGTLERRLRAGDFHLALIAMPDPESMTGLAVEARLAATGMVAGAWQGQLQAVLLQPLSRQKVAAQAILRDMEEKHQVLPLAQVKPCLEMSGEGAARDVLPWLTGMPASHFRPVTP